MNSHAPIDIDTTARTAMRRLALLVVVMVGFLSASG
jgi:hypothetical protein